MVDMAQAVAKPPARDPRAELARAVGRLRDGLPDVLLAKAQAPGKVEK